MSRKHTSAAVEIPMHADAMHIEWWPIGDPIPYEKNARKWSDQAIAKVAASIRKDRDRYRRRKSTFRLRALRFPA